MLIVGMRHVEVRSTVVAACEQVGMTVRPDAPPPSNLEDEVAAGLAVRDKGG